MVENEDTRPRRACPHCAEMILAEAKVCRFCGRDVPAPATLGPIAGDAPTPPHGTPAIVTGPPIPPGSAPAGSVVTGPRVPTRQPVNTLAIGGGLVLAGIALTWPIGSCGAGFLAVWLGIGIMLSRQSWLVTIAGGFVLACIVSMPFAALQGKQAAQKETAEKAAKAKVDAEKAAEEAKQKEAALVADFPRHKATISAEVTAAESLSRAGRWADAKGAVTRADQAIKPALASKELATDADLLALSGRLEKLRPTIAKEMEAIRVKETVAQVREAQAQAKRLHGQEREELRNLLGWYKQNEVRADQLYKGQRVRVRGYVKDVKKDILNNAYITVGREQFDLEIPTVQCFLADSSIPASASLSPGEMVTVAGRVDGLMFNVLVKECTLP